MDTIAAAISGATQPRAYEVYLRTVSGATQLYLSTRTAYRNGQWHEAAMTVAPTVPDQARSRFSLQGGGAFNINLATSDFAKLQLWRTELRNREFELTLRTWANNADGSVREIVYITRAIVKAITRTRTSLDLQCESFALKAIEAAHPALRLTKESWPLIFVDHQGRVVPDGAGFVIKAPLSYIGFVGGKYRYAGLRQRAGYTYSAVTVYRAGSVVPGAEYTMLSAASTGSPAYTVDAFDFNREQLDLQKKQYDLTYDVTVQNAAGTAHYANRELAFLLAEWGIGIGAYIASSGCDAVVLANEMFADCSYGREMTRADIIKYLLMILRADLVQQASGAWDIVQDVAGSATSDWREAAGDEIAIKQSTDPVRNQTHRLKWRSRDARSNELTRIIERALGGASGVGEEMNPLVFRKNTADRLSDYLAKSEINREDHSLDIYGVQGTYGERINVQGGGIVTSLPVILRGINRATDKNEIAAISYVAATYVYTAGPLPSDATDYEVDYSLTPPAAPTALTIVSNVTSLDATGKAFAVLLVRATPPSLNWAKLFCVVTNNVNNTQTAPIELTLNAGNYEASVGLLLPSTAHTVRVYAVNSNDVTGVGAAQAVTTATYSGAPPSPGAVTLQQTVGATLMGAVPPPTYAHHERVEWQFRIGAGGVFAAINENAAAAVIENASYGGVYQFQARYVDQSGNPGPWVQSAFVTVIKNISDSNVLTSGINGISIGPSSINRGRTATGTGTISFAVAPGASVGVTLALYTFFPRIQANVFPGGALNGWIYLTPSVTVGGIGGSGGGVDEGLFAVRNTDTVETFNFVGGYRTFSP
jgi:hypothetical protein